jgi:hypothetical protein
MRTRLPRFILWLVAAIVLIAAILVMLPRRSAAPEIKNEMTLTQNVSAKSILNQRDKTSKSKSQPAETTRPASQTGKSQTSTDDPDAAEIEKLISPSIPIKERLQAIQALGKRGEEHDIAILKRIGDMDTYLNYAAVESLGQVKNDDVALYLRGKLGHADSRVICAAIYSLAAVSGKSAIPFLAETLATNHTRDDGHHDVIRNACVESFGKIGAPEAFPYLKSELECSIKDLGYNYASTVVKALEQIGTPEVIPVIEGYLADLQRDHNAMSDNPMGQEFLKSKIDETKGALARLRAKKD